MLRTTLARLRAHTLRLLLTAAAIVLGVGFLSGALVYGDTATAAFFDDLARSARQVDVRVAPAGVVDFAETSRRVDFDTLDSVRAVPGVARVDGRIAERMPMLDPGGRLIAKLGDVGWAVSVSGEPSLAMYDVAAGRLPDAAGEVAVDRSTVDTYGFGLGRPVVVLDPDQRPVTLTLVGVLDLGANKRFAGLTVAALTGPDLVRLVRPRGYAEVVATAQPGTGQQELAGRVAAVARTRYEVFTGERWRARLATEAGKYVDGFLRVIFGFSLVALAVCGFVIANTFAMLVAHRLRELALLRCIGASRVQLLGSVLVESAVTGVLASTGGLLAGVGVGYGLLLARDLFGQAVPVHGLVLQPRTAVLAVVAGTAITVLAALGAALTASRVPPLAALRTAGGAPLAGRRRVLVRLLVAVLLAGLGAVAMLAGVRGGFESIGEVFAGGVVLFAAVVLLLPLVVAPLVGAVGALPVRLLAALPGGARLAAPARLAVANARRNPRRVAATTSALAVGLALMSMVSVVLATAKVQSQRELDENFPVDYVVSGVYVRDSDSTELPLGAAAALRARPELAAAAGVRLGDATVADQQARVWTGEPGKLTGPLRPEVMEGALPDAHPGAVALNRNFAAQVRLEVGDRATVTRGGRTLSLTVTALYDDAPVSSPVLLDWADYTTLYGGGQAVDQLLVKAVSGVPPGVSRHAVEEALQPYPLVEVSSLVDRRSGLVGALDRQLGMLLSLLGISIVIGLCGIANTLSLSVVERSGESALLRAVGLTRGQLRGTLLVEALLVAVLGGVLGVIMGTLVGWVAAAGLIGTYGHGAPVVPIGQLGLYLGLAAVAGALAAVLPARRAARAPVVAALSSE